MKATVTKAFPGRPDNEALSRTITVGETIFGDLASVAVNEGNAEEVHDEAAAAEPGSDLLKLSKSKLEAIAAERGVDISGAATKGQIIAALEAADQA